MDTEQFERRVIRSETLSARSPRLHRLGVFAMLGVGYAAIGTVTNQAARLCSEAGDGQILASETLVSRVEGRVRSRPLGALQLKGLRNPIATHEILDLAGE